MVKIQSLAYFVAQSTDVSKWKDYGENILGTASSAAPDGGLYLKMDEREFRVAVVKGSEDRYYASGWEVANKAAFDAAVAALAKAGVKAEPANDALKKARKVADLVSFSDPAGNRHELSYGYNGANGAFKSPIGVGGFKTGKQGVGHTVLPALPFDATLAF